MAPHLNLNIVAQGISRDPIMSKISILFNDKIEILFDLRTIAMIPVLHDLYMAQECQHASCPPGTELKHILLLEKFVKKAFMIPMIDFISHSDVLIFIRFVKHLRLDDGLITLCFAGWTLHEQWIQLKNPEYIYMLHAEHEFLVDFKRFFRAHPAPYDIILGAASLPEMINNPDLYIEMMIFIEKFDIITCFDENNAKIRARINVLKKERGAIWNAFLIDPHSPHMAGYFRYNSPSYDVWSCEKITAVSKPIPGEMTIVSLDVALGRLREFTYGLLDKSINPHVKEPFPFENVAIAGGSVGKILTHNYEIKNARQSDIDLFIFAPTFESKLATFERIVDWFKKYSGPASKHAASDTYYAIRGSVLTIYIKGVSRKFQVISMNSSNPYEILSRFDLTHIQWCILNGKFYGTASACKSMRERVTCIHNARRLRIERIVKALYCGFSVRKVQNLVDNIIDISSLIEDPSSIQLQKYIRELYGWYYPTDTQNMSEAEERYHILCMI
jgi:hypothetical protein